MRLLESFCSRNPASLIPPPKIERGELAILSSPQVKTVVDELAGSEIYPHVVLLLSTGIRRGELMALQWGDIDLDRCKAKIERAIEATRNKGLRIKAPKTQHGRRLITLPPIAVEALREHRKAQLELRLKLGIGKLLPEHYVFGDLEGALRHPDWLTYHWKHFVETRNLPRVTLHAPAFTRLGAHRLWTGCCHCVASARACQPDDYALGLCPSFR